LKLAVNVQIAASRRGVPHARNLVRWANAAAAHTSWKTAEITIRVVGAAESRKLNRTWRGQDKPTNVLSFPGEGHAPSLSLPRKRGREREARLSLSLMRTARKEETRLPPSPARGGQSGRSEQEPPLLGDLAICAPIVAREAREQGKSAQAHWAHMVVHGVLHLLGYDHERDRDATQMEAREVKILAQFGYSNPYG
jgi:probable rRNA maturation factor